MPGSQLTEQLALDCPEAVPVGVREVGDEGDDGEDEESPCGGDSPVLLVVAEGGGQEGTGCGASHLRTHPGVAVSGGGAAQESVAQDPHHRHGGAVGQQVQVRGRHSKLVVGHLQLPGLSDHHGLGLDHAEHVVSDGQLGQPRHGEAAPGQGGEGAVRHRELANIVSRDLSRDRETE